MRLFGRGNILPAGLDLGYDGVKLLQLEATPDGLAVVAALRRPLPPEAAGDPVLRLKAGTELARQMLSQAGFVGRKIVASLPREFVHFRTVRVPTGSAEKVDKAARSEAPRVFDFDLSRARVHYLNVGEVHHGGGGQTEVIVAASPDAHIRQFLLALDNAGFDAEALDLEPCALFRAADRLTPNRESCAVLDVGCAHSQLVIGGGGRVRFIRQIGTGARHVHEVVSQRLGVGADEARQLCKRLSEQPVLPDSQRDPVRRAVFDASRGVLTALAEEVARGLRYSAVAFRGTQPSRLIVVGGGATDASLRTALAAALDVPVEPGRWIDRLDLTNLRDADRDTSPEQWAVALGLALKVAKPQPTRAAAEILQV